MLDIGRRVTKLSGYAPALPTPFLPDGAIDFDAFQAFCEVQIEEGATALVACGTTGEAPTLSSHERSELVRLTAKTAAGRVPVIAGAGSNSTARAIELARDAEANGADAILSVVPYYNKPTQAGMEAHFRAVAGSTNLPLILYDVPSRTGCGLLVETIRRLADVPGIIGLKDATGDIARATRLRRLLGPEFRLLSGDDTTALAFLAQGGDGCISVTSNLAPSLCRSLHLALQHGQLARAQTLARPIDQLTTALFRETSPAPLKYALSLLGLMSANVRLPLVEPASTTRSEVAAAIGHVCQGYAEHIIAKPSKLGGTLVHASSG